MSPLWLVCPHVISFLIPKIVWLGLGWFLTFLEPVEVKQAQAAELVVVEAVLEEPAVIAAVIANTGAATPTDVTQEVVVLPPLPRLLPDDEFYNEEWDGVPEPAGPSESWLAQLKEQSGAPESYDLTLL